MRTLQRRRTLQLVGATGLALATGLAPVWAAAQETVRFGVSAPITGNQAQYGTDIRSGIELAIEQLNQEAFLPGTTFEMVVEDSKSDPKEAANVAQKFASSGDVLAVVGDFSSTACLAAAPIYQRAGILMMTPTASHPDVTKTGDYIFRTTPIASFEAGVVTDWAVDLGSKKVGIIGRNDDYGRSYGQVFREQAEAAGMEVVAEEYLNAADKDFKPLIASMRSSAPDTVLLALFQVEAAQLFQQAREMGFAPTWLSGASLFNPQLIDLAGSAADGLLLVSAFYPASDKPAVKAFVEAYQAKYGSEPSKFAAHSYDSVRLIADAIKQAGSTDGAAVRDALAATNGFEGVIGTVTVDDAREIEIDLERLEVKDGQFVPWTG